MSFKSSPWWNGSQESFFGRFKVEFGDVDRFETLSDLVEALYRQLADHSNVRIKSELRMSPVQFRREWEQRRAETVIHSYPQVISLPPDPPPAASRQQTTADSFCIKSV